MDWASHDYQVPTERPTPQLDLLRLFWRMQSPGGKLLTCGLYQTAAGLEVRCEFGGDDLIRSQYAPNPGMADQLAAAWKMTALAKAGFVELEA